MDKRQEYIAEKSFCGCYRCKEVRENESKYVIETRVGNIINNTQVRGIVKECSDEK